MNYDTWDYSHNSWIPKETNEQIYELFKSNSSDTVGSYIIWLNKNHPQFLYNYRENVFPRLLEFNHFDIADYLLEEKIYTFNEKIAKACAFHIGLDFKDNVFSYWLNKVKTLNKHDQHSVYSKFWSEFLGYQFLRQEEVKNNLPNLVEVFDKVPFYIDSEYDIVNGYLIKAREDFFKNRLPNHPEDLQLTILQQIALLSAQHYPQFKSTFEEEFQKYPSLISVFDKVQFYEKLNQLLEPKNNTKKNKI